MARIDGAVVFESQLDSVSWADMAIADRVFDLGGTLAGVSDRRRLDRSPRDASGLVRRGVPFLALEPGPHRLEFEATDEAGNTTTRAARLTVLPLGVPREGTRLRSKLLAAAPPGGWELAARGDAVYVAARASDPRPPFAAWPGLALADSFAVVGGTVWTLAVPGPAPAELGAPGVLLAGRGAGASELAAAGDERVDLSWSEDAFHEPAALVVTTTPARAAGRDGLLPRGALEVTVGPADLALAAPVRLAWRGAKAAPGTGLFRRSGAGWSLVAAADSGGDFAAATRRLGTFALLADTTAPRIVPPRAYAARTGVVPPAFVARVTDAGAGLDAADQVVELDGRRVPAEYDPESSRLTWRPRAPLAAGAHVVVVTAVDALGNRASVRVPIEVR